MHQHAISARSGCISVRRHSTSLGRSATSKPCTCQLRVDDESLAFCWQPQCPEGHSEISNLSTFVSSHVVCDVCVRMYVSMCAIVHIRAHVCECDAM